MHLETVVSARETDGRSISDISICWSVTYTENVLSRLSAQLTVSVAGNVVQSTLLGELPLPGLEPRRGDLDCQLTEPERPLVTGGDDRPVGRDPAQQHGRAARALDCRRGCPDNRQIHRSRVASQRSRCRR